MIQSGGTLHHREVAVAGRLASMSRLEAIAKIQELGGIYARRVNERTSFLVLGHHSSLLRGNGKLCQSLRTAEELQRAGNAIHILPESEFLQVVGLHDSVERLNKLFALHQVARMLELPVQQLRLWVRTGLLAPTKMVRRLWWFDFQQVALARAIKRLTAVGVTANQLRRSLEHLERWLPAKDHLLQRLEVRPAAGEPLIVRLDSGQRAEPNGQLLLAFDAPEPEAESPTLSLPERGSDREPPLDAEAEAAEPWFVMGVEAEGRGDLGQAEVGYRRALEVGGPQVETLFNLGNVIYGLDRLTEAIGYYAQALQLDPEFVEAWNNLGNALCDLRRPQEAVAAYRRAVELMPEFADAHSNLAEALVQQGLWLEARTHWEQYLELDPHSEWSKTIRSRLKLMEFRNQRQ
jgi:tetratricopeptide (TPR) repeat protein